MLDIKFVRANAEKVKAAVRSRNGNLDAQIDELLEIDNERRDLTAKVEKMKAEQNVASKQIPALKKEGKDVSEIMARMKTISDQIKEISAELSALEDR